MSDTTATVPSFPPCDIHKFGKGGELVEAHYDGKTVNGPWAFMCDDCFASEGIGLGVGRGQRLVLSERS